MSQPNQNQPLPANIELQVEEPYRDQVPQALLVQAVAATLAHQEAGSLEVTLVIGGDSLLQQLNREYRDVDAPTDVLSFGARDGTDAGSPFVTAPEAQAYLGDVIISFPTAARQAAAAGQPVARELCLLAVHGVLHLLGYDHATPEERAAMWAIQGTVLAGLGQEP